MKLDVKCEMDVKCEIGCKMYEEIGNEDIESDFRVEQELIAKRLCPKLFNLCLKLTT